MTLKKLGFLYAKDFEQHSLKNISFNVKSDEKLKCKFKTLPDRFIFK